MNSVIGGRLDNFMHLCDHSYQTHPKHAPCNPPSATARGHDSRAQLTSTTAQELRKTGDATPWASRKMASVCWSISHMSSVNALGTTVSVSTWGVTHRKDTSTYTHTPVLNTRWTHRKPFNRNIALEPRVSRGD